MGTRRKRMLGIPSRAPLSPFQIDFFFFFFFLLRRKKKKVGEVCAANSFVFA
jgi:hypothetical protein